ncbi:MAG: transposase [Acidobacteriota bacterium]
MARKTKLTPELQQRVIEAISGGNSIEIAAEYAGIKQSTFYNWMERGQREQKRLAETPRAKPVETETPFLEFLEAVKKARIDAEVAAVAAIRLAGKQHWQANAWWLERAFPERWARRDLLRSLNIDVSELTDEQLERISEGEDVIHVLATPSKSRTGTKAQDT